jgi:hypothetical protein
MQAVADGFTVTVEAKLLRKYLMQQLLRCLQRQLSWESNVKGVQKAVGEFARFGM